MPVSSHIRVTLRKSCKSLGTWPGIDWTRGPGWDKNNWQALWQLIIPTVPSPSSCVPASPGDAPSPHHTGHHTFNVEDTTQGTTHTHTGHHHTTLATTTPQRASHRALSHHTGHHFYFKTLNSIQEKWWCQIQIVGSFSFVFSIRKWKMSKLKSVCVYVYVAFRQS